MIEQKRIRQRIQDKEVDKIINIIDSYFDNPCNVCEARGMDGKCIIQRHQCPFDFQEDMKLDMAVEIRDAIRRDD